jgi:hypothetical protein
VEDGGYGGTASVVSPRFLALWFGLGLKTLKWCHVWVM